jgi:hypothetical protein
MSRCYNSLPSAPPQVCCGNVFYRLCFNPLHLLLIFEEINKLLFQFDMNLALYWIDKEKINIVLLIS